MNKPGRIVAALVFIAALTANAANDEAVAKAREAALAWLALTDAGNGAKSWQAAAAPFRAAVARESWERSLAAARGPLGAPKERSLKSATYARKLPGAPDGEYVVIQYATRFENKTSAIETVTPMREKDGSWKVSGYYIK